MLEIQPITAIKTIILADIPDSIGQPFRSSVAKQVRASGMMKDVTLRAGAYFMSELLTAAPATTPAVPIDPASDTAVFQFTGGTSGLPKAAELTHRNLVANIAQINAWAPSLQPGAEKFLLALPAFHVYGMTVGMLTCLKLGGELLLAPDPRNTLQVMQIIARARRSPSIRACRPCTSPSSTIPGWPTMTCTASASASAAARRCRPRWRSSWSK